MVATGEIFRHASRLYVYRIVYGPHAVLTQAMELSLQSALYLLTFVLDVIGPRANLGWCLVVIGAKVDSVGISDQGGIACIY